mmetsp:Transcript_53328/g.114586  ORF Transcript_53328/g.114586 Transcript_53328/m.114586 type:complete len:200 (-) Transcript_53328:131-730(-)
MWTMARLTWTLLRCSSAPLGRSWSPSSSATCGVVGTTPDPGPWSIPATTSRGRVRATTSRSQCVSKILGRLCKMSTSPSTSTARVAVAVPRPSGTSRTLTAEWWRAGLGAKSSVATPWTMRATALVSLLLVFDEHQTAASASQPWACPLEAPCTRTPSQTCSASPSWIRGSCRGWTRNPCARSPQLLSRRLLPVPSHDW